MLGEMPNGHLLHVVRNPWSAYADTKKRPVPLPLESYMQGWVICQYYALMMKKRYPDRVHVVGVEDVLEDTTCALTPVCQAMGVDRRRSIRCQPGMEQFWTRYIHGAPYAKRVQQQTARPPRNCQPKSGTEFAMPPEGISPPSITKTSGINL